MIPENMIREDMIPEKLTEGFLSRLLRADGPNVETVILFGSTARTGSFDTDHSNINLLCLLRATPFSALHAIAPVMEWWRQQKQPAPIVVTRAELERSADVFSIELLDMQATHKVLYGDDALGAISVPRYWHRAQIEYELREKLILLRQRLFLTVSNEQHMWDLLLQSLTSFTVLMRHALMELGATIPAGRRELLAAAATLLSFDASAFTQLIDIRESKLESRALDVKDVASRYLAAVERMTAAVDTMLESTGPGGS